MLSALGFTLGHYIKTHKYLIEMDFFFFFLNYCLNTHLALFKHIYKFQNTVKVEYLFTESMEALLTLSIFRCESKTRKKTSADFLAVLHQIYMRVKTDSPKFVLEWREIQTNTFYTAWLKYLLFQIPFSSRSFRFKWNYEAVWNEMLFQ